MMTTCSSVLSCVRDSLTRSLLVGVTLSALLAPDSALAQPLAVAAPEPASKGVPPASGRPSTWYSARTSKCSRA